MLRIYPVSLAMVAEVTPYVERIGRRDRDLGRQLRKASTAVPLNLAEGSGNRGGRRRNSYDIALGEAIETLACLDAALSTGYIHAIAPTLRRKLDHIIGTLINILH